MSTILDALKKVEQERDTDSDAARQRQLDALNPTLENARQGRTRKYLKMGALLLLVLLLGGTTLYLFFGDRQPSAQKATRPDADSPQAPAPKKRVKKTVVAKNRSSRPPKHAEQPTPRTAREQQRKAGQQPDRSQAAPRDRSSQPPSETPQATAKGKETIASNRARRTTPAEGVTTPPPPEQPPSRQYPARTQPTAPLKSKPAAPPQNPASRTPQPTRAPQATQANDDIPRLTDGSLKVQAIAWSPNRDESMAVINGKILREGGSVDDYTLVRIREDDVVVRKAGGEWRVVIGRN